MHRPPSPHRHRASTNRAKLILAALSVGALIAAGGVAGAATDGFGLAAGASQHVTCTGPSLTWRQADATSGDLSCAPNPQTDVALIPGNLLTVAQQSVETDPTGWEVPTTTVHHDGSRALKVSTRESYLSAPIAVTPGQRLNLSAYAASAGGDRLGIEVDFYRHGRYVGWDSAHKRGQDNPAVGSGFAQVALTGITVPTRVDGVVVDFYGEHGDVYVDTVYLGSDGTSNPTTTPNPTTDNPPTTNPPPDPPTTTTVPPPADSNVVFEDDFDHGWGQWSADTGCGWGDGEPQSYTGSQASTTGGIGTLTVDRGGSGDCGYTSARMQTGTTHPVTLESGQPLTVSARIQMPHVNNPQGLWPAFWMWQTNGSGGYCANNCAEIDITEWYGNEPDVQTAHLHGPTEYETEPDTGTDLSAGYHTYGMHWDGQGHITFLLDGQTIGSHSASGFAGREFMLIANLALTPSGSGHGTVTANTTLPATMNIDWVKVTK